MIVFVSTFNNDIFQGDDGSLTPVAGLNTGPSRTSPLAATPFVKTVFTYQDYRFSESRR